MAFEYKFKIINNPHSKRMYLKIIEFEKIIEIIEVCKNTNINQLKH